MYGLRISTKNSYEARVACRRFPQASPGVWSIDLQIGESINCLRVIISTWNANHLTDCIVDFEGDPDTDSNPE